MINVSGKISKPELDVYEAIANAAHGPGIPWLVRASARDLILHHAHDAPIIRATGDIDIAVQVQGWEDSSVLKANLLGSGFTATDQTQRLLSPLGVPVDIVPCGGIEDNESRIHWMPEGVIRMSVLGLREALEHSDLVRVRDEPELEISVATVAGLSILEILAWTERPVDQRRKDAMDLLYLLKNCERSPPFNEQVYEHPDILEAYDWDTTLAASQLLGATARQIMSTESVILFSALQAGEMTPLVIERLIDEMTPGSQFHDRSKALMAAYLKGFSD